MITLWSIFSAMLWFSLSACLLFALRRNDDFLIRYGVAVWSGAMILTVARMLFPLDSEYMVVLRSYHVLPALYRMLSYELVAGFSVGRLLIALWITGTLLGFIFVLYGLFRDGRRLRQFPSLPPSPSIKAAAQACGLDIGIIRISPAVTAPMTTGLLHPTVYLPINDYPEAALPCILKHEANHIAGHDSWLKLGFLLFRCLFWWNPVVHFAQKSVVDILELRCDQAALAGASSEEQLVYVQAMAYTVQQVLQPSFSFIGAASFVQPNNKDLVALRAKLVLRNAHPPKWRVLAVLTLCFALFIGSYLFIFQSAGFPAENDGDFPIHGFLPQTSYLKQTPCGDYELWSNGEYAGSFPADALDNELFQNLEVRS